MRILTPITPPKTLVWLRSDSVRRIQLLTTNAWLGDVLTLNIGDLMSSRSYASILSTCIRLLLLKLSGLGCSTCSETNMSSDGHSRFGRRVTRLTCNAHDTQRRQSASVAHLCTPERIGNRRISLDFGLDGVSARTTEVGLVHVEFE